MAFQVFARRNEIFNAASKQPVQGRCTLKGLGCVDRTHPRVCLWLGQQGMECLEDSQQVADPNAKSSSIGHLQLSLRNLSFKDLPVKSADLSFDEVKYDFNALKKRSDVRLIAFSNGRATGGPTVIDPVLLQTFLAVAETRSFTQAGARLG
ncbi:MAG: hypothetical protein EOP21_12855, partial [Hyphomicrobiales bacterium]